MQKITPHLWFDRQAEEAARCYTSLFPDAKLGTTTHYGKAGFEVHGMPEGTAMTVSFTLAGQRFIALNGGPVFSFNPSISFLVSCETAVEVDALWKPLVEGGTVLMELGNYPFSERYGWLQDRYGLSWQLMHAGARSITQRITPTLMFVGAQSGRAEEAMGLYSSVLGGAIGDILRYPEGMAPEKPGTVMHAGFTLAGQEFAAMDSANRHEFAFNEAISFLVRCTNQEEIDTYWDKLSADPNAEQCGWLKDRFGVSWQIVPTALDTMMQDSDPVKVQRVTEAFLKMKKLDLSTLRAAYERGEGG